MSQQERKCDTCKHYLGLGRCGSTDVCDALSFQGWKSRADAPAARQEPATAPETERKHSHYFKDVSALQSVDVYRVLSLFAVTDPCIQHAVKKLLCAGGRGVKDQARDVQEAIDTLERWHEMREEEGGQQ